MSDVETLTLLIIFLGTRHKDGVKGLFLCDGDVVWLIGDFEEFKEFSLHLLDQDITSEII